MRKTYVILFVLGLIIGVPILYYMYSSSDSGFGGGFLSNYLMMTPMPSTCRNTDSGDDPFMPGYTQGPDGYGTGWDNMYMDKCANVSNYPPDKYGEHLWEAVCVQAKWAQDAKEYDSGWSSSYIKHDCNCIQPSTSSPAYCLAVATTPPQTTTTQATTTTPPTLPTQSTTTTFYSGGGGGSEPNWLMDLWNSVLGWLWRWG